MPHVAPINWLLTLATFWLTLSLFMSIFWWSQTPSLQVKYTPSMPPMSPWKWS